MEDREVFYVDVGNMSKEKINELIEETAKGFSARVYTVDRLEHNVHPVEPLLGTIIEKIWEWNDIAGTQKNETTMALYKNLITEEYEEFLEAYGNKDHVEELDACVDMIWVIVGYMRSRGWSKELSKAAFDEVQRSNFSKFVDDNGEVKCVKREDGKILKPSTFSPADISGLFV